VVEQKEPTSTLSPTGFDQVTSKGARMDLHLCPQTAAFICDNGTHAVDGSLIDGRGFSLDQSFKQSKHGGLIRIEIRHRLIL
jgi:hypothetical protein